MLSGRHNSIAKIQLTWNHKKTNTQKQKEPKHSKVAGVWRSLSWCLESVMLWRGIMGFTKFGDKCVNDLDLL